MNKLELLQLLTDTLTDDTKSTQNLYKEVQKHLLNQEKTSVISLHRATVKSVRKIRKAEDEWVYDIGMRNESKPWFFGNNILLHNSVYFSAYTTLKNEIDKGQIHWDRDSVVALYDNISEEVNATFPTFMLDDFHCPKSRGNVIKAGRELVASKGLFITKKRYAVLYYDKDGKRNDINGSLGKVKAMGLDLKRSDTPVFMQVFLEEILTKVLNGAEESVILERINEFRTEFKLKEGWEKGSPKRVNNIAIYRAKDLKGGKFSMPGHVRASLNWNTLKRMNGDNYSMTITDGMKVIVCKVRPNPMGFTSVAYPADELRLPEWFQNLPFDHAEMEVVIINNKIDNLIGVLDMDLHSTNLTNTFNSLFD